jgi:hypothetical protein
MMDQDNDTDFWLEEETEDTGRHLQTCAAEAQCKQGQQGVGAVVDSYHLTDSKHVQAHNPRREGRSVLPASTSQRMAPRTRSRRGAP